MESNLQNIFDSLKVDKKINKQNQNQGKCSRKSIRKIAVLDFETDPFKYGRMPRVFAAGYYDGEDYKEWWGKDCPQRIGDFLLTQDVICYAHNGGKFDFFYLLEFLNLNDHEEGQKFKMINGRIAVAVMGKCELRDSFLILPMAQAKYKKTKIDYDIFEENERDKLENKKEIKVYLKDDCLDLYEWVSSFVNRFGRKLTVAGAAFSEIKKTGYNAGRKTCDTYDADHRPFYYGGRCEAIKPGVHKGHYKYIDINSAYSYAMLHQHPYGPKYTSYNGDDIGQEIPENDCYFVRITAISNGALPYRDEKTKKILYFRDDIEREYNASGWEIRAGLETGTLIIKNIERVLIAEETKDFSEFVNKFFNEKAIAKECGDKAAELENKIILNAGYGKFGQNGSAFREYELYPTGYNPLTDEDRDMAKMLGTSPGEYLTNWLGWIEEAECPGGYSIWSKPDPAEDYYNVATAASITAFVRAYLWRAICESKNPVYCDTDSIMCEDFNGEIGKDIGQWSQDAECNDTLYIGGRKLYTFMGTDGEVHKAHKGARLTHEQIIDIVKNNKPFEWYNDALSFSLKFGIFPDMNVDERRKVSKRDGFVKRKIKVTAVSE